MEREARWPRSCRVGQVPLQTGRPQVQTWEREGFGGGAYWGEPLGILYPGVLTDKGQSSFEILEVTLTSRAGKPARKRGHCRQFRYEQPFCTLQGQNYRHLSTPTVHQAPSPLPQMEAEARLGWVRRLPFCLVRAPFLIHQQKSPLGPGTPQAAQPPQGLLGLHSPEEASRQHLVNPLSLTQLHPKQPDRRWYVQFSKLPKEEAALVPH